MSEEKLLITMDYKSSYCPPGYECGTCEAFGVKLWREYNVIAEFTGLFCAACAKIAQSKPDIMLRPDGRYHAEYGRTDQIGSLIPAVPDETATTYWGYTSVPAPAVLWWRRLPLTVEAKESA